jgi:hypothetical protein
MQKRISWLRHGMSNHPTSLLLFCPQQSDHPANR